MPADGMRSLRTRSPRFRLRLSLLLLNALCLAGLGCRASEPEAGRSTTAATGTATAATAARSAPTGLTPTAPDPPAAKAHAPKAAPAEPDPAMLAALEGSAYAIIDIASGRTLTQQRPDWLDTPVWPGSIAKIATIAAALESGALTPETRITCTRRLRLADGREADCSHPELGHPLSAVDALAHSCNIFAATLAGRLTPAALARGFTRFGLPAPPARADRVGVALGLVGQKVPPRTLLGMMRRIAAPAQARTPASPSSADERVMELLREGLRGSAREGTAAAFAASGIGALAKTGTALMPNGHPLGLVIAAWPDTAPREAVVLAMPGGVGTQAAALAALLARQRAASATGSSRAGGAATRGDSAANTATGAAQDGRDAATVLRVGTPVGAGYRVENVPLEEYVAGVVTGESSDETPEAVREALAITARSYALANRGRHAEDGFDLCRLTHCQVARAVASAGARGAASRTRGLVLRAPAAAGGDARTAGTGTAAAGAAGTAAVGAGAVGAGATGGGTAGAGAAGGGAAPPAPVPVQVFYSASCGGRLADASAVLPALARGGLAWMTERPDPAGVPEPSWHTELRADELLRALQRAGLRGDSLRHLAARRASRDDRDVSRILLDGLTPPELRADDFRRIIGQQLGWEKLKSLRFTVTRSASGYRFDGRGHGHGVGLCVFGASALAARGASAEQLLATYFPGLALQTISTAARVPERAEPGAGNDERSVRAVDRPARPVMPVMREMQTMTAIELRLPVESEADRERLHAWLAAQLARLARLLAVDPPARLAVIVHPTGDSYRRATRRPWWTSASTVTEGEGTSPAIHTVPLVALRRDGRWQATLRHELVHVLTMPMLRTRPLWVQEGVAIHYAALGAAADGAASSEGAVKHVAQTVPPASARAPTSCPADALFRQTRDRVATERAYAAAAVCVAEALAAGLAWRDLGIR